MLYKSNIFILVFTMIFISGCDYSGKNNSNSKDKSSDTISENVEQGNNGATDMCINNYIDSNNESAVNEKKLAMYDIDYMSLMNGLAVVVCNAKYENGELDSKSITDLLRNINISSKYGSYIINLPNQKVSIPVVSNNVSEQLASNLAHFVYMHQNQTVDDLLTSIQISLRNPPMTYNYYGCTKCFESNINVTIVHSNDINHH